MNPAEIVPSWSQSIFNEKWATLGTFKEGRICFNCADWSALTLFFIMCLNFNKGRKGFVEKKAKNGVMPVVIIQMSSVGDLQGWKVLWEKPVGLI